MTDNGDATTTQQFPPTPRLNPASAAEAVRIRLGEELPVFCERCGYSLHGLTQIRCDACRVLHFACPECGHHQPINTLRPAFQRILGRLRALGLATIVFLKINFFFWVLFGFAGLATEIAYEYDHYQTQSAGRWSKMPAEFETEGGVILFILGASFAMIGRMLLLRWRRGTLVGLSLAGLTVFAMLAGAHFEQLAYHTPLPSPLGVGFIMFLACIAAGVFAGATAVWGIWLALAFAFLPRRIAASLIAWQRGMSEDVRPRDNKVTNADAALSVES